MLHSFPMYFHSNVSFLNIFVQKDLTFVIYSYIASIVQYHVVPDVPYISDSATYSPESCIFGQLINTGCVLRNTEIVTENNEQVSENFF